MARPISKITSKILSLKPGQTAVMPRGAKRATIGSYVYNANQRVNCPQAFSTKIVTVKGRKHVAVVHNAA